MEKCRSAMQYIVVSAVSVIPVDPIMGGFYWRNRRCMSTTMESMYISTECTSRT